MTIEAQNVAITGSTSHKLAEAAMEIARLQQENNELRKMLNSMAAGNTTKLDKIIELLQQLGVR